jgi:N6-L-threonylcarbamoyladenine synthase
MVSDRLNSTQKANIAASFQRIAIETVVDKALIAFNEFGPKSFVIAGGVASNQELREQIKKRFPIEVTYTDPKLCTDNGAMIASLGYYQAKSNFGIANPYSLEIKPGLSM